MAERSAQERTLRWEQAAATVSWCCTRGQPGLFGNAACQASGALYTHRICEAGHSQHVIAPMHYLQQYVETELHGGASAGNSCGDSQSKHTGAQSAPEGSLWLTILHIGQLLKIQTTS